MTFQFKCPSGCLLEGEPTQAGSTIQCPLCSQWFVIPAPVAAAPQHPAAQPLPPSAAHRAAASLRTATQRASASRDTSASHALSSGAPTSRRGLNSPRPINRHRIKRRHIPTRRRLNNRRHTSRRSNRQSRPCPTPTRPRHPFWVRDIGRCTSIAPPVTLLKHRVSLRGSRRHARTALSNSNCLRRRVMNTRRRSRWSGADAKRRSATPGSTGRSSSGSLSSLECFLANQVTTRLADVALVSHPAAARLSNAFV